MKLFLLSLLSASLLFLPQGVFGAAEALAPAPVKDKYPKPPKLEFLYTVNITGGETYNVGNGPNGLRLVVPILNGTFAGPRLKGLFCFYCLSLPLPFPLSQSSLDLYDSPSTSPSTSFPPFSLLPLPHLTVPISHPIPYPSSSPFLLPCSFFLSQQERQTYDTD